MSAAPDLEILQRFLKEVRAQLDSELVPQGIGLQGQIDLRHDLLCLANAMAHGSWYVPGQNRPRWTAYRDFLMMLPCRSLLTPWCNSDVLSDDQVAELKRALEVTEQLRNEADDVCWP